MSIYKIISIILHPIFMPFIAIYLSIKLIPSIAFATTNHIYFIYLILIVNTIILPLISVFFLIKRKWISSIEMNEFKERSLPLFITAICITLGYYQLEGILVFSPILKSEIIGAIIIVACSSAISLYWKISLHMLALGGVIGITTALNILFGGLEEIVMLFIFLGGVLGVARLKEKAHNKAQIYIGCLVGFLIEVSSILLF